jgi:hypothetical protein
MPSEFVLTPDEAAVIRAGDDDAPFYELAAATKFVPSRVRAVLKTLRDKNLTSGSPDVLQLTSDGRTVQRLLKVRGGGAFGRIHIVDKDDPEKGKWGGLSERNGRILTATVRPAFGGDDWFQIDLRVAATDPNQRTLTGPVEFHLHPTLYPNTQTVVATDNVAKLGVIAYGAFTVGALADNGDTRLELDLSEIDGVPERFRTS